MNLRERMVRVEESLNKNYELMKQGFGLMEKKFEQVDKSFEEMAANNNARFDELRTDMNQHFKQMFTYSTTGMVLLAVLMSVYQFLT